MLGPKAHVVAVLAALASGALAGLDFADNIHREFGMGIFPRAAADLQSFNGALGGVKASPITQSNDATRQFQVDGDTFNDFQSAVNRACDNQHNKCADVANSNKKGSLTVGDCDTQNSACKSSASSAPQKAFVTLASSNDQFDFFCEN